jgi:hypothetical protein
MTHIANDYPYIRSWGRIMGSFRYFVEDEIDRARVDGAPQNAIHRKDDGTWATTDDVRSDETRRRLGLDPVPTSVLPPHFVIAIEMDWSDTSGATLTVRKSGRQIYRDLFASVQEAADRAVLEIRVDQQTQG